MFDQGPLSRSFWRRHAWRASSGSVAIQVGLLLTVLIGFVALGTEVVALLMTSRRMQVAADSAALAAVKARTTGYPTAYADEAIALARTAGFAQGQSGTTVTVNSPPQSGNYTSKSNAVEVIIVQPQTVMFVSLFRGGTLDLTARSVGTVGGTGLCALALDGSASAAIQVSNGATVNLRDCGIGANSTSNSAISVTGAATLTTSSLSVVGNYTVSNGGILNVSGATKAGADATADPYEGRAVPTPGTCLPGGTISNKTVALPAGTYCSGISLTNASTVTLNGIYILKDSNFSIAGGSRISGTATIVLTGTGTGSKIGTVTIGNGSTTNIAAPTTGPTAGMVFFQDRRAPSSGVNDFVGGTSNTLNGALYFPKQIVNYSNGSSTGATCTQLIARKIVFKGGTTFNLNCDSSGTTPMGGSNTAQLVE
jgi:Flp pilus assembly protein TadG